MTSQDQSYPVEVKHEEKTSMMDTIKIKTQEVKDKIFKKSEGSKDTTSPLAEEGKGETHDSNDQTRDYVIVPENDDHIVKEKAHETTESTHDDSTEAHTPKYGGTLETTPSQIKRVAHEAAEVAQETLGVGEVAKDGTEKYATTSTAEKE